MKPAARKRRDRAVKELKPMYEAVYNDLKDLMDVNVQKGDQTEAILVVMEIIVVIIIIAVIILSVLSGRRYGKSDRRWNRKAVAADVRTPENICRRRS